MLQTRSLLDSLLSLLFPERCSGCETLGALLCARCRATLVPYRDDGWRAPPGLSGVQVAFVFDGPLRHAIHQLKYRGQRRVAQPLGVLMAQQYASRPWHVQAVMAIPLHRSRQAERGYNQAEELGRAVAAAVKLPFVAEGLVRTRETQQQAQLDARARRENIRGAFAWRAALAPPERILLIDDVVTTGSTMSACALGLREGGAREVYGLALARSRLDP